MIGKPLVDAKFTASHHSPEDEEPSPMQATWKRLKSNLCAANAIPVIVAEAIGRGAVGGNTPL